jgi:hypothetical protein
MYSDAKDTGRLHRSTNRFPETIQECYAQFEKNLAVGEEIRLPSVVQVILRFYDRIISRPKACLTAISSTSLEQALEELDTAGDALIRASSIAGNDTENGLALSVCRSAFDDYSHAVGVAMCVHVLTPGATFKDIADLRRSVADVFHKFYGNMGLTTPYRIVSRDMYLTKYITSCARSILGLYAYIPSALSHFDEGVIE